MEMKMEIKVNETLILNFINLAFSYWQKGIIVLITKQNEQYLRGDYPEMWAKRNEQYLLGGLSWNVNKTKWAILTKGTTLQCVKTKWAIFTRVNYYPKP